jgi:hypothetical protein
VVRSWEVVQHLLSTILGSPSQHDTTSGEPKDFVSLWPNQTSIFSQDFFFAFPRVDCGVFNLAFAMCFSLNKSVDFSQAGIPSLRNWITQTMVNHGVQNNTGRDITLLRVISRMRGSELIGLQRSCVSISKLEIKSAQTILFLFLSVKCPMVVWEKVSYLSHSN